VYVNDGEERDFLRGKGGGAALKAEAGLGKKKLGGSNWVVDLLRRLVLFGEIILVSGARGVIG
jgi:hypothetical protein